MSEYCKLFQLTCNIFKLFGFFFIYLVAKIKKYKFISSAKTSSKNPGNSIALKLRSVIDVAKLTLEPVRLLPPSPWCNNNPLKLITAKLVFICLFGIFFCPDLLPQESNAALTETSWLSYQKSRFINTITSTPCARTAHAAAPAKEQISTKVTTPPKKPKLELNTLNSENTLDSECTKRAFLFDVGSSTTKSTNYLLDKCKSKIMQKTPYNLQHNYQYCLNASELPDKCIESGIEVLEKIIKYNNIDCKKEKCYAIATAWARNSSNIHKWVEKVKSLGIKIKVLSQEKEALFGFYSSLQYAQHNNIDADDILYFDIGGGSFQIVSIKANSKKLSAQTSYTKRYKYADLAILKSSYGTDNYTGFMLEKFKGMPQNDLKNIKDKIKNIVIFTPAELDAMIKFTIDLYRPQFAANKAIEAKLNRQAYPNLKFISNGMFMRLGLRVQLGIKRDFVTREQLKQLAYRFAECKNAQDIAKKFPKLPRGLYFSSQTSLVLLYSIMEILNMDIMHIANNDVLDYLAIAKNMHK